MTCSVSTVPSATSFRTHVSITLCASASAARASSIENGAAMSADPTFG
jgi:hypothetical protein